MLAITPYIAFQGTCRQAVDFYKETIGATVLFLQTYGESPMAEMGPAANIMHCTIEACGSKIMMCDSPGAEPAGSNISLAIGLNDVERAKDIFDKLAGGGTVNMPLQKTFWAAAFGIVTDKYGVKWMVNCDEPR